jgi:hypothetical protein
MTCPFCGAECVPSVIADWRCERCENWYEEEEDEEACASPVVGDERERDDPWRDDGGEAVAPLIEDMILRIELIVERTEQQGDIWNALVACVELACGERRLVPAALFRRAGFPESVILRWQGHFAPLPSYHSAWLRRQLSTLGITS